ncbi:prepilin peptidase [Burkholderia sp. Bp8963]|uniref:A24 family peptidase n=1 Tax=Burkholderia sp. Bp8963 TaxID=2184547 RepID=UPI000F5A19B0|nr:prepilin peptidase [Burkholderia sp. Bp8963]RQS67064.1 prepilin peptidase [Burkholderia sp. Bp8963]
MALLFCTGVFFAWAMLVALGDIRFRRVPNVLVVFGLVGAFGATLVHANPFGMSVMQAWVGMLVGLIGLFPFFAFRVMGAADVKVFAVLGAWCGVHALLGLWIVASLAAGIHALALVLLSGTSFGALWQRGAPALVLGGRRATPYAACLTLPAAAWLGYLVVSGGVR